MHFACSTIPVAQKKKTKKQKNRDIQCDLLVVPIENSPFSNPRRLAIGDSSILVFQAQPLIFQ